MRFIHTADWHLGKTLRGASLLADQAHWLRGFIQLVKESTPDAVVIAGDLFERAIPPPEAVTLLDDVLSEIVLGLGVPVIAIAGNHDSGERLAFGSRILNDRGLHVAGVLSGEVSPVIIDGIAFWPVPWHEPAEARNFLGTPSPPKPANSDGGPHPLGTPLSRVALVPLPTSSSGSPPSPQRDSSLPKNANQEIGAPREIHTYEEAMLSVLTGIRANRGRVGGRHVLVAHAFVAGGVACESERPLSIGGSGVIPTKVFRGFDYVALGHLHCAQFIETEAIRYAGSPLKYSFSEVEHRKTVEIVEIDMAGLVGTEQIVIPALRDLRRIEGTLNELLARAESDAGKGDYLQAVITNSEPVYEAYPRLRAVYPNLLAVELASLRSAIAAPSATPDFRRTSDLDLFRAFYQHATGASMEPEHERELIAVLEDLRRAGVE